MNKTLLVGRITRDAELRKTPNGASTVSFTVAVNRKIKQEGQPNADFINCVAWNKTAEFMGNYVKQGALLGVEGRIQVRSYKDQSDKTVYVTEVVCDSVQILSQKQENGSNNGSIEKEFGSTLDVDSDMLPF
jgi:single-strand DNA-binding protein